MKLDKPSKTNTFLGATLLIAGCFHNADSDETGEVVIDWDSLSYQETEPQRALHTVAGRRVGLDPSLGDLSKDAKVRFDLDGDRIFDVEVKASELPYFHTFQETGEVTIWIAIGIAAIPWKVNVTNDGDSFLTEAKQPRVVVEAVTTNICAPCADLDHYLHDTLAYGTDATETVALEPGQLHVIKHHEIDAQTCTVSEKRIDELRSGLGNPFIYVNGLHEIAGFGEEDVPVLAASIRDALEESPEFGLDVRAFDRCGDAGGCADVLVDIHALEPSATSKNLRLHALVFESNVEPGSPNLYFEINHFVTREGGDWDLGSIAENESLLLSRRIRLLDDDGDSVFSGADPSPSSGVLVLLEDRDRCDPDHPSRCAIIHSAAAMFQGQSGQRTENHDES